MKGLVIIQGYREHARAVDSEFLREAEVFKGRIQCGRGCSMCCSQMFSISTIEAAYISSAVKAMPEADRARLRAAANDYLARAKTMTGPAQNSDGEQSITPRPGLRLPCPALREDACSIYEARPLICRKWGVPIFNPKKPSELQACELNFHPGEEIDVDEIIEPQADLLAQWVELKNRARACLQKPISTTTVAEALIYDYEETLFGGAPENAFEQVSDPITRVHDH